MTNFQVSPKGWILISVHVSTFSLDGRRSPQNISSYQGRFIFQFVHESLTLFGFRKGNTGINSCMRIFYQHDFAPDEKKAKVELTMFSIQIVNISGF